MNRRATLAMAVGLSLGVTPALAAAGGSYSGKTSDRHAVSFRTKGSKVTAFSLESRFTCSNHGTFVAHATYRGLKISRGRFSAKFANPGGSLRTTITGAIRGKRASGSISRRATFNGARKLDPRGSLVCISHTSWTARRR
jgi:hypothetical protein